MKKSRTVRAALAVEVDRRAPRRLVPLGEELRRVRVQVVAFGAEVVVDDVEQHHEPARVRGVDEALQILGRAVGRVGRELQHAVVAPVAAAGKVGERHELDRRDAEIGEVVEPPLDAGERAFRA